MSYLLNVANERPMLRISEAADAATNDTARGPRTMVTTYLRLVDGLA
jgi:hypothetical protein